MALTEEQREAIEAFVREVLAEQRNAEPPEAQNAQPEGSADLKQWRKNWSRKPTLIPPTEAATGLWYSEECVDQMLAEWNAVASAHLLPKPEDDPNIEADMDAVVASWDWNHHSLREMITRDTVKQMIRDACCIYRARLASRHNAPRIDPAVEAVKEVLKKPVNYGYNKIGPDAAAAEIVAAVDAARRITEEGKK